MSLGSYSLNYMESYHEISWSLESREIRCSSYRIAINFGRCLGSNAVEMPVKYESDRTTLNPSWWHHQMETISALLANCAGNSPVPGEFPHKGQWRGALMFSLICAWINDWVNNREAGDLRRNLAHYDVTVMISRGFEISRELRKWRPTLRQ